MTDFKHFLRQIADLYFIADWNGDAFVRAQWLKNDLLEARNSNAVTYKEYKALYPLVSHLINEMRDTLKRADELH